MSARVVMVAAVFLLAILSSVFSAPAESQATVESWQSGSGGSDYDDLVTLFFEFRAAQDTTNSDGVPDYTPAAIERRYQELQRFHGRLASFANKAYLEQ